MTLPFVFVHGWGYDPSLWDTVIRQLPPQQNYKRVALFEDKLIDLPEQFIGVGHSLGVLWLLRHHAAPMQKLISIGGTNNFTGEHGTPLRVLKQMQTAFSRDPDTVLQGFWQASGAVGMRSDIVKLQDGLSWLATWDVRGIYAVASLDTLVLHSENDQIISLKHAQSCFMDAKTVVHPGDNHALPLTNPTWCAEHINAFCSDDV